MDWLASGPAARRAGSPGITWEMANVRHSRPNSIRPRKATRPRRYCVSGGASSLGRDRQRIEVHLAGEPYRAEHESLHVVAHAPAAVGEHAEDLGGVGGDTLLDLGVDRRPLLPLRQRAGALDHAPHVGVGVEGRAVVLAPGVL